MVDSIPVNYPTAQVAPTNPLTTLGEYQNISNAMAQNRLLNQHIEQAQVATQQALGQQRVAQIISNNTVNGHTDWLGVKSDSAKDTLAAMNMDHVNAIADPQLALTNFGVVPQGQANAGAQIQKPLQQIQEATSGNAPQDNASLPHGQVMTSLPPAQLADMMANQSSGQTQFASLKQNAQNGTTIADNAKLALNSLDEGVKTGKYAPAITNAKAALASIVGEKNVPETTNDVAGMQILGKELARVLQSQGGADNTDLARLQSEAANADITKSTPAIHKILQYVQAKGLQDQSIFNGAVKTHGANPQGNDINSYAANFTDPQVPQIYRYLIMSPQERQQFMSENFKTVAAKNAFLQKADSLKKLNAIPSSQ